MTLSRLLDSFARQTNVTSLHAFQVFLVIAESHPLPLLRSSLKQYPALRDDPETTLARSVRKLIKTNMVQQVPDPVDTRTTQIYLTDDGRRLWARFSPWAIHSGDHAPELAQVNTPNWHND
jgi:DNA-binding MarR family transcriptional regulator